MAGSPVILNFDQNLRRHPNDKPINWQLKAFRLIRVKEVGKGTGLGLSISEGLIASHGGKIFYDIKSPNTRFVIELPLEICREEKVPA